MLWPVFCKIIEIGSRARTRALSQVLPATYINLTWESEWIPDAKAMVVQLWKKYRSAGDPTSDLISDSSSPYSSAVTKYIY